MSDLNTITPEILRNRDKEFSRYLGAGVVIGLGRTVNRELGQALERIMELEAEIAERKRLGANYPQEMQEKAEADLAQIEAERTATRLLHRKAIVEVKAERDQALKVCRGVIEATEGTYGEMLAALEAIREVLNA